MARRPVSLHAAQMLAARGRSDGAIEAYRELLRQDPRHRGNLKAITALLRRTGRHEEGVRYLRELHDLDLESLGVEDEHREAAIRFYLAADGVDAPPDRAPGGFVAALFDDYSDRFDDHLVGNLGYRGPEVLRQAVIATIGEGAAGLTILDAGCGTGLAGLHFRDLAGRLHGIDLSPGMIEKARARGIYDALEVADLVTAISRRRAAYDLIVAADVFVYLGDLGPVYEACRRALVPGGLLAFTTETGELPGYRLRDTRRYAHHPADLKNAIEEAGFRVESTDETVLRYNRSVPVRSNVWVTALGASPPR